MTATTPGMLNTGSRIDARDAPSPTDAPTMTAYAWRG